MSARASTPGSPMSGNDRDSFHARLASIVEVLANTAVAEICKLVDDGFTVLRLEVSQNQRVIDGLRRKLLLAKIQTSRRSHLERLGALRRAGNVTRPAVRSTGGSETGRSRGTGRDRESESPVVVKEERVESNGLDDVQAPVNSSVSANSSSKLESRSARAHPERQKGLDTLNRNADQTFQAHTSPFSSQSSSENATWESYCPISNSDGAFTCTTNNYNNNTSFSSSSQWAEASADVETWNNPSPGTHSGEPTRNPSPGRRGATGTKSDGGGGSEGGVGSVSADLGNVGSTLAGSLDWNPDMMVVSSVPIKVEEDMRVEWSVMDGDMRSGGVSAKWRQQRESQAADGNRRKEVRGGGVGGDGDGKERGVGGEVAVKYPPHLRDIATAERSTLDVKTLPSYGGLSSSSSCSSSSFSTTVKSARQVLHPQSNQMDKPDTLSNLAACSSRGGLGYPPPSALLSQCLVSGRGHQYHCELCGKTFTKFPSLRRHQRVHTGEKPFSCRHCAKCFSHRHQVKNHERVHTGEKPFCCPICGRCFVQSSHMKRHLNTHASGDRGIS